MWKFGAIFLELTSKMGFSSETKRASIALETSLKSCFQGGCFELSLSPIAHMVRKLWPQQWLEQFQISNFRINILFFWDVFQKAEHFILHKIVGLFDTQTIQKTGDIRDFRTPPDFRSPTLRNIWARSRRRRRKKILGSVGAQRRKSRLSADYKCVGIWECKYSRSC